MAVIMQTALSPSHREVPRQSLDVETPTGLCLSGYRVEIISHCGSVSETRPLTVGLKLAKNTLLPNV